MLDLTATYEVITFSVGDTKSGAKMGKLQVKKTFDDSIMNCILWEEALGRINPVYFRCGNLIKILGGTYNEKFNNALITDIELVKEAKLGLSEEEQEETFGYIYDSVQKISDNELKTYVSGLLKEHKSALKVTPAAKMMHHNYMGGLLQHIKECLEISKTLLETLYTKINPDYATAACVMHDFGKIFEYKIDSETGLIEYNEEFRKDWITHSQWGFTNLMAKGFKEVAKMVAAHHARTEWGAIIDLSGKDLENELYFLHHVDDLSAKLGKININDLR